MFRIVFSTGPHVFFYCGEGQWVGTSLVFETLAEAQSRLATDLPRINPFHRSRIAIQEI